MCIDYRKEKEIILKHEEYSKCYQRATGIMRENNITPEVPGYTLLVQAYCVMKLQGYTDDEKLFSFMEHVSLIPSINPVVKDIHPAEQWMKEALRTVGIKEDPIEFLKGYLK